MFETVPFDKLLEAIEKKYNRERNFSEHLREELDKVKDEKYKDNELQEIKQELETMRKEYYRGFPISKEEDEKIKTFIKKHNEMHGSYHGCIGGGYTYKFCPTSIGTSGSIICNRCKEEFEFQELG